MQAHQVTLFVDGYFTSVWDAVCFVTLTEKQIEFTTARALLRDGQGVPAALRQQCPIARIPALQHGDFLLTESQAIVEYLEEVFPPPGWARMLPALPEARARARQAMSWMRTELHALRAERPWQLAIYPGLPEHPPLSAAAERNATELIELAGYLSATDELEDWNIAHADIAFGLLRLTYAGYPLPAVAQRLLDRNLERPSVRGYLEHPRPPNPPPYPRS